LTIKEGGDLFLVFLDTSLKNPFNGEIDIDMNWGTENGEIRLESNGRYFVPGDKNTFLFNTSESVLEIDHKEKKIISQFNYENHLLIFNFDCDPYD
jgi:hypothetical protein